MGLFEEATKIVSVIGLFSSNESYDEIPTNDLKYFLLPYFLGNLALRLCGGDRLDIVRVVEVYFRDFLSRCEVYGFFEKKTDLVRKGNEDTPQPTDEFLELTQMAHDRNYKLKKFQEKKDLQEQVKQLKLVMERDQDDDSTKRDYYLKLIKMSTIEMEDELSSLETEKRCLAMMALRDKDGLDEKPVKRKPMQTVIITKDAAMKAVYGAGYPSLPVLSVDEFYEQRVAEGIFPDPTVVKAKSSLQDRLDLDEPEEIDKENAEKVNCFYNF